MNNSFKNKKKTSILFIVCKWAQNTASNSISDKRGININLRQHCVF